VSRRSADHHERDHGRGYIQSGDNSADDQSGRYLWSLKLGYKQFPTSPHENPLSRYRLVSRYETTLRKVTRHGCVAAHRSITAELKSDGVRDHNL
jgi:hypothetical protein